MEMRHAPAVLLLVMLGCSRTRQTDVADGATNETTYLAPPPPRVSASLPQHIATFDAGPLVPGDGFSRRTYSRANAQVTVTLAHIDLGAGGYDRWVRQSEDGYPQAALDLPAGAGNGFYQCTDGAMMRCNLLIQLRNGVHLEIRGDDRTMRADVDAVAAGLPLRGL
jgi:hypothetical protein